MTNYPSFKSVEKLVKDFPSISSEKNLVGVDNKYGDIDFSAKKPNKKIGKRKPRSSQNNANIRIEDRLMKETPESYRSVNSKVTLNDEEQFKLDKRLNNYFHNIDDYLNNGENLNDYDDNPRD